LVERARGPYKVNALAERAALATLDESGDALGWIRAHAALAVENRERLALRLRALGFAPLPSAANFLFVPTARATVLGRRLQERGVLVRAFAELPGDLDALAQSNGEALRIGVGPWEMMETLLAALEEIA
jgi:histidinol-phosphate/aromatic aminotransferase/cobyric acid decarboxylase-like protein